MSQLIRCPHCGKPALSVVSVKDEAEHKAAIEKSRKQAGARSIRIDDAGFSKRVRNGLKNFRIYEMKDPGDRESWYYRHAPIHTFGDLCLKTEYDLGGAGNRLGKVSIAEIKAVLKAHGLYLGMTDDEMSLEDYGIPATVGEAKAQVKAWADEDRAWEAAETNPTFL